MSDFLNLNGSGTRRMRGTDGQTEQASSRRVARAVVPAPVRHRLGVWLSEMWIGGLPDRVYMERELIPAVARRAGKVLFVGCRRYTSHYPALVEAHGGECATIDMDPAVARWGAAGRHVTGPIQEAEAHWSPASFDTIVLSGVFGFGLNDVQDQEAALRVCRRLLKPDGWLILGWNTDRSADPSGLVALRTLFVPASVQGVAQRQTFAQSTHVFDNFTAAEAILP
jgi:hypothetical protein